MGAKRHAGSIKTEQRRRDCGGPKRHRAFAPGQHPLVPRSRAEHEDSHVKLGRGSLLGCLDCPSSVSNPQLQACALSQVGLFATAHPHTDHWTALICEFELCERFAATGCPEVDIYPCGVEL